MGPVGPCLTCISKANTCCTLLKSCYGDNPLNQCGYGGPTTSDNEFNSFNTSTLGDHQNHRAGFVTVASDTKLFDVYSNAAGHKIKFRRQV